MICHSLYTHTHTNNNTEEQKFSGSERSFFFFFLLTTKSISQSNNLHQLLMFPGWDDKSDICLHLQWAAPQKKSQSKETLSFYKGYWWCSHLPFWGETLITSLECKKISSGVAKEGITRFIALKCKQKLQEGKAFLLTILGCL